MFEFQDNGSFSALARSAVEYAAGRTTYLPSCVQDVLLDNAGCVSEDDAEEICTYIEELHEQGGLGMDFDDAGWTSFARRFADLDHDCDDVAVFNADEDFWLFVSAAFRRDVLGGGFSDEETYTQILSDYWDEFNWKWDAVFARELAGFDADSIHGRVGEAPREWRMFAEMLAAWEEDNR